MIILVARGDSAEEFALRRVAGGDDEIVIDLGLRAFLEIEPEVGLPFGLVRAVAPKACVGEDGPDLAVELNLRRQRETLAAHRPHRGHEHEKKALDWKE